MNVERLAIFLEDEDERLVADPLGDADRRLAVQRHEGHVRSSVAGLERPLLALVVADHADDVAGPDPPGDERAHDADENGEGQKHFSKDFHIPT